VAAVACRKVNLCEVIMDDVCEREKDQQQQHDYVNYMNYKVNDGCTTLQSIKREALL
jgi:hypothetical protein